MDHRRFDALTRAFADRLPRRRLLGRLGGSGLAAMAALRSGGNRSAAQRGYETPAAAEEPTAEPTQPPVTRATEGATRAAEGRGRKVEVFCEECNCDGDECECCLSGITGGGAVELPNGAAQLVLFASRLEEGAPQAVGFVRWFDPNAEGGELTLESIGPITYEEIPGQEQTREVRGTMQANGAGQHPFVLRVSDAGPAALGQDTAALAAGDRAAEGGAQTGFGYGAEGKLIGGDLQLLGQVAAVST